MKHNIKYVISLVFMFLLTQGAWADPAVTIIKQLNGSPAATASPGEVTSEIANGKCTLTVTPADGNYVTKDFITVYSVVTGNVAQGPRRTPDLDNTPIAVSNKGENTDPTGVTTYEFTMPTDGSDAEVTVNFHSITTYNLFIGDTQVTELNAADVLGNGKVSFTSVLNNQVITNTLTLNGAELTVPVKVGLDNLTIDIQGTNSITTAETCIQKMENTTPAVTFTSTSSPVGSLWLKTTGDGGVNTVGEYNVGSFSISNELTLIMKNSGLVYSNTYYFTDGPTKEAVFAPAYDITVGEMPVTMGNADDILGTGKASYDAENNILTLNGIELGGDNGSVKYAGSENLTIALKGWNKLTGIVCTSQAETKPTLTFKKAEGALSPQLRVTSDFTAATNFSSVSYQDWLGLKTETEDETTYYYVMTKTPTIAGSLNGLEGKWYVDVTSPFEGTVKYSLTYADENLAENNKTNETFAEAFPLLGPATIKATITIGSETSPEETAYYFGVMPNPLKFEYDGETAPAFAATLYPSVEGVSFTPTYSPGDFATFSEGEVTINGFGSGLAYASLNLPEDRTFSVITDSIGFRMDVLPAAPTIDFSSEVTYLDTDNIEVTAAEGMTIFYTWDTTVEVGNSYIDNPEHSDITLSTYDSENPINAETGTLRAWAGYLLGDDEYLLSEVATQAFAVKKDINNAAIYISAASATYTGAAITPSFTVKASAEAEDNLVEGTDYTVRYEKVEGVQQPQEIQQPQAPRRAPEESESVTIKDAGLYNIIITGKGNYGGTKTVGFTVTQAENSLTTTPAAVAELIYTGDALELVTAGVAKFGDVLYKLGADGTYSATIPTATDANTTGYTVYYKVEGNDNYTGIDEASIVVSIAKATATITKAPAAKTLTYTGDALELVEAGTVSAGTMVYSTAIDGTFAEAIPTGTNAGSYTVYYKVNGDDNYTGIEASETNKVTVTIGQAEITSVELEEPTLAYSGEAQTPTIVKVMAGDIEVGAEYYEITGGNAKTDVGEYELTVAAKTMEGNNFKGSATTTWGIVNRTLTVGEDVQFADGQKWASFYTPSEDLELPEGVMAYIVTGVNESEKSVTVKAVNKVLKSVPMLLENNSTETTTNVSAEGNLLQVATEATAVSSINGTVYGLYNNAMMRVTTGTIALGKCYLVVNGKQNAPRLTITKDDQATGIESLTPALSEGEGAWYTIDGKKLQQKPTKKGIYIVNGKKMVVNNK